MKTFHMFLLIVIFLSHFLFPQEKIIMLSKKVGKEWKGKMP